METIRFKHLELLPGQKLLDLGCGEGRHAIGALFAQPELEVFYVDLDLKDLSTGKARLDDFFTDQNPSALAIQSDATHLPFADHTFDHIVCSEVLEHIPAYEVVIKEMHRLLKPGGTLSISVPRYWPEKVCWWLSDAYHQVEGGHIRIFTRRWLQRLWQAPDYRLVRREWAHALHVPYWWLRCAFWQSGEDFFLCRGYHTFLVWDLLKKPRLTRTLDALLNPVMGKSVILYFHKNSALSDDF